MPPRSRLQRESSRELTDAHEMMSKKLAVIAVLSVGHFAATVAVFFAAVGNTMSRFDTGARASVGSVVLQGLAATLLFPLGTAVYYARWMVAGYPGWAPVALNSLLWACALYWAGTLLRRRLVSNRVRSAVSTGENE